MKGVPINPILSGSMENVGASRDLQIMETNVLEIKKVQTQRIPVMLVLSSIHNKNGVFLAQKDASAA